MEKKKQKTFDDLEFTTSPFSERDEQAKLEFENGYGVRVTNCDTYNPEEPDLLFRIAVTKDDRMCWEKSLPIVTIAGECSPEQVTEIMKQVQELKRNPLKEGDK